MITGAVLAVCMYLSLVFTYKKLPEPAKAFLREHRLVTDGLATFSTWVFLTSVSKTIAALIGAMFTGLLVDVTLHLAFGEPEKKKVQKAEKKASAAQ